MLNQWRSQNFTFGMAHSDPLTALIGYLNVLLEYFFFKFSLAGHNQALHAWPALSYAPVSKVICHSFAHFIRVIYEYLSPVELII